MQFNLFTNDECLGSSPNIANAMLPAGFRVLVACEESQTVCKAFRALGIEAFSCDVQECSGGYPEWHIQGDAIAEAYSGKYDLMIAHPPCTYLSKAGARWLYKGGKLNAERYELGLQGKAFFEAMLNAPKKHIAIDNPTPMKIYGLPMMTAQSAGCWNALCKKPVSGYAVLKVPIRSLWLCVLSSRTRS